MRSVFSLKVVLGSLVLLMGCEDSEIRTEVAESISKHTEASL